MISNQDILAFLQADQDARTKEKEEDKKTRAKERQEDRENILEMVKIGVAKAVKVAMEEVELRLEHQEKINQELTKQLQSVVMEMDVLKIAVDDQQQFPALPQPQYQGSDRLEDINRSSEGGATGGWGTESRKSTEDYNSSVEEMCAAGRRVVGFTPIEPRMLDIQMQSYGAKNLEEAMLFEIKSYLKCEMKVRPSDIEKLDIVRIFHPAKENWNVLYVEFGNEYQVDKLFTYTRGMVKKDHRVVRWFPKQMYDRYRAVESMAYEIRKNLKQKTRVKIGRNDLELSTREIGSSFWRRQALPTSLPKIDLDSSFRPAILSSPPPGRPGRGQLFGRSIGGMEQAEGGLRIENEELVADAETQN